MHDLSHQKNRLPAFFPRLAAFLLFIVILTLIPRHTTATTTCDGTPNCVIGLSQAGWVVEHNFGGTLTNSAMFPDGVEIANGMIGVLQTIPAVTVDANSTYVVTGVYDRVGETGNFNISVELPDGSSGAIYSDWMPAQFTGSTFEVPLATVGGATGDLKVRIWKDADIVLNVTDVFLHYTGALPTGLPQAAAGAANQAGNANTVYLDSQFSIGDGNITSQTWHFGDGATSTSPAVAHTYANAGDYTPTLVVTDEQGGTDHTFLSLQVHGGGYVETCDMAPLEQGAWEIEHPFGGVMNDSAAFIDGVELSGGIVGVKQSVTDVNIYYADTFVLKGYYDVEGSTGNFNISVELPGGSTAAAYSFHDPDDYLRDDGTFRIPVTAQTVAQGEMIVRVWMDDGLTLDVANVRLENQNCNLRARPSCSGGGCKLHIPR